MLKIMVVKPAPAYDEPGVEAGYTWEHLGSDGNYITERIAELDTDKSYLVLPGEFPDCSPGYVQFGDFKTSKKYGPHRNPLVWNIEDAPYACMFEHMKDVLPADATDIAKLCAVLTGERKEKQREVGYFLRQLVTNRTHAFRTGIWLSDRCSMLGNLAFLRNSGAR